jgi:hypothetical protein
MYGLAAVSKKVRPEAITKRAKRKNSKILALAAGTKRRAPIANKIRPKRIPFL